MQLISPAQAERVIVTYPQQQYPQPGYQGPMHIDPRYAPVPPAGPYQPPQQQYVPQTQPAQGPAGGAALATPAPALSTGGGNVGGSWPKLRHLQGCTVIFVPQRVDENAMDTSTPPKPRPEAYFHLIVVDSPTGTIQYGDSLDAAAPKPLTWERQTPCLFTNVNDYGWGSVNEVRNALSAGESARVGVIERGTLGNRPYMITKPDKMVGGGDRPDGQQRFERAAAVWGQVHASLNGNPAAFNNPEPRALLAPPAAPVQQVAYGQPQQQLPAPSGYAQVQQYVQATGHVPGYSPPPTVPQPYLPTTQQYVTPQGQPVDVAQNGYAPQQGYGQYAPQQPAYNPAFEAYISSLPAEQQAQAQARAQYAAQQQGAMPAPGGPGI